MQAEQQHEPNETICDVRESVHACGNLQDIRGISQHGRVSIEERYSA